MLADVVREVVCSSMRSARREGEAGSGRRRARESVDEGGVRGVVVVSGCEEGSVSDLNAVLKMSKDVMMQQYKEAYGCSRSSRALRVCRLCLGF